MKQFVYADNAATTAVSREVLDEMLPYFCEKYGNPSSIYSIGREAHEAVDTARRRVAGALGAQQQEIYFTSGGSEADNWAIRGAAHRMAGKGRHLITTKIEHHAVLHTMRALEKEGFSVTYLDVDGGGFVSPEALEKALRPDTTLVSVMYANNEIGTIEPIPILGEICAAHGVLFHTDAVQAAGHLPIDVAASHIDLLSLSAHKFHGPKGVGALYIRRGLSLPNLIEGGAQERARRAGTENVAGIAGLGKALELSCEGMEARGARTLALRERLLEGLLQVPRTHLNGSRENRLPGNANISVEGVEGESLLLLLDMNGVCASSGSACTSGSLDPSHVLLALGLSQELAHGSLRFTLDGENTEEDVDRILAVFPKIVNQLRSMSPF